MKLLIKASCLGLLLFLLGVGAEAQAIPEIWGVWSWEHTEPVQIMTSPGDGGSPLAQAVYFGGEPVDATITVQLWARSDFNPDDPPPPAPVAMYPREDIWLEAPGLVPCWGPSLNPDADTDANGWFTFTSSPALSGWTDPGGPYPYLWVMVSGDALLDTDGQPIMTTILTNSPDLDGNQVVDLADLAIFAGDFFGEYAFRSDFFWDGVVNLADVAQLAATFGESCP